MADQEQPKRNIDERIDALTMNLELLYRDRIEDREQIRLHHEEFLKDREQRREEHERWREEHERWQVEHEKEALALRHLRESVDSLGDSVDKLLTVVQSHENRIVKLERAS